jgi:RNA polymerase sigma factor (sigma-70 family)
MTDDLNLLDRYARDNSQAAFVELVRRHLNLVYSAALRQVRSPQLAEEVAQSVFTDLAHNAGKLKPGTVLTAWLYQVTRRTSVDVVRKESRCQLREQIASEMNAMNATAPDWTHVEPFLDEAMSALGDTDRAAVLLRYFENKSFREVGQTLGTSDDAAQKRVSRAIEHLREFLSERGVTVGVSGLVVLIAANAVQAAPAGLAATISTAAVLAGTTIAATTATKAIAMTTLQKILITTTLAGIASAGIYESRQASTLRSQVQTLQQQEAPLAEQIRQLQRERDEATNQLAALAEEMVKTKSDNIELLKLHGEVARLRREKLHSAKSAGETDDSGTIGKIRWCPEWKDAGLNSPEAAIETYFWATVNGNVDRLRQCMVFDHGSNCVPVSEIFARREARTEGKWWSGVQHGGVRISKIHQAGNNDQGHAEIEVEIMRSPIEAGQMVLVDPANPPPWNPTIKNTYKLMKVDGEWKMIGDEQRVKLTLDDEDSQAVAKLLMTLPPEQIEEIKSKSLIPAETLRVYEELKAQGAK